ncbi:hypothetical protein PAHAL_9G233500 [Panicum hallii]|uniref:Uncharacterized protein n=1 Tax=Panicum hallii TaxID=206008 RepID=A0A2T8I287_9POAL|nr:hypothetical protein PAHAL_9G233500 [Panicum hallii]
MGRAERSLHELPCPFPLRRVKHHCFRIQIRHMMSHRPVQARVAVVSSFELKLHRSIEADSAEAIPPHSSSGTRRIVFRKRRKGLHQLRRPSPP